LTDLSRTDLAISNWHAMLRHGWEAGDLDASAEAVADAIEARLRTGRPLAAADWITRMETTSGRQLAPRKRGPKRRHQLCTRVPYTVPGTSPSPELAPRHIVNAPTRLMEERGHGAGYAYHHDAPEGFSGQDYWPEGLGRKHFYEPTDRGRERAISERLAHWEQMRANLRP
jgi:hypothetical protein